MWISRILSVFRSSDKTETKGTVKFFNRKKGYGFIESEQLEQDVFVHISDLEDRISKGDEVKFVIADSPKGLEARRVRRSTN